MPEVGDSALIHYYGGETTSDSDFGAWSSSLDDTYKHTHFVIRAAWNGNVTVPTSPSVFLRIMMQVAGIQALITTEVLVMDMEVTVGRLGITDKRMAF